MSGACTARHAILRDARSLGMAVHAIAVATLLAWFVAYSRWRPTTFYDESSHLKAMRAIASGDFGLHPELPMFPGYHWIVVAVSRPFGVDLSIARLTSLGFAIGGTFLYSATRRRLVGDDQLAPLRFAWLPLLFPFTAMAYTDVPSVVLVLGAVWAVTRDRPLESALWLAAACAVRQTNVIWALFLVGWVTLDWWPSPSAVARRVAGYAVVVAGCAAVFLALGRVQAYPVEGQEVMVNLNHLYVVAPLALVLWWPVWLARLPSDLRRLHAVVSRRPAALFAALVTLFGIGVWLAGDYTIAHPGNAFTGYFVRNEPLLWMRDSLGLRALGIALAFVAGYLVVGLVWTQPNHRLAALILAIGALSVALHGLVDPRYYLAPSVLLGLFIELERAIERRLVIWQGALCLVLAALIRHDWLW
jgi:hypothetical protein